MPGAFQRVFVERLAGNWLRLQDDLQPALQIETPADGVASAYSSDVEGWLGERDPPRDQCEQNDERQSQPGSGTQPAVSTLCKAEWPACGEPT